MLTPVFAAAITDVCTAVMVLQILSCFLDPQLGAADPSAQAPPLLELLLPLAALGVLFTAVAVIYHRLHHTSAGVGNRRLGGLFTILCISTGTLHLFFFVKPAGVGVGRDDVGAQARALGLAAARVLPAAAAATFFLGMVLIIIAHIRAGGEGGGGASATGRQIQGPVLFLTKIAYVAAAALVWLMAMALYGPTAIY